MQNIYKAHCPAKINLFLKILGKRNDGYSSLESLFAFLDLYDILEVEKNKNFQLEIAGEFSSELDLKNNLFTKILDYFLNNFNIDNHLKIKITKNIPIGAGLGGGSSDAAFFIQIINQIFHLNLSKQFLQEISLNFGSDIAFFFENQASIIRGRGEIIKNFYSFAPIATLLINPKINLSTKEVFAKFNQNYSTEISDQEIYNQDIFELIKDFPNDLTSAAISLTEKINEILHEAKKPPALTAKMSGSGSTCFAIFANDQDLKIAKENLLKKFPDFYIKETKILSYI